MNIPDEINCTEQVFDLKYHPYNNIIGVGLINGLINLYSYSSSSSTSSTLVLQLNHHLGSSCRGIQFDNDGNKLFSISSDRSWAYIDSNGSVISRYNNSHITSLNKCTIVNENIFATGDDNGCIKLWDVRNNSEISTYHKHEDFVTSLSYYSDEYTLISTSGDSTLCTYDIRKKIPRTGAGDVVTLSDEQESEINCAQIIKNGKKVICGTQKGVILTFSWGKWGDCTDRYPGHPHPVDCMLKIDENTIITGSSDGLIRVVGIQPNKIYGVLGDHDDFPVEGMDRSRDGLYLATYSHDEIVRFWDTSMFAHDEPDENEDNNGDNDNGGDEETKGNDFNGEEDNDEDDEWESDSDMSEEEEENNGEDDDEDDDNDNEQEQMIGSGGIFSQTSLTTTTSTTTTTTTTNNNNNNNNNKKGGKKKSNNDSDDSDDSDSSDDSDDDNNKKNNKKKNKKKNNNSNNSKMPPFRLPSNSKGRGFYSDMK